MKYMFVMSQNLENAAVDFTSEEMERVIAEMGAYNEALMQAGILVGGDGLEPADKAVRVEFDGEERSIVDGPYAEAKEVFAGFWIVDVATLEEAVEWARRAPLQDGSIDVRRIPGIDEFPQDNEWIEKERGWRKELGEDVE